MRPSGLTEVASTKSSPAPDSASDPRCAMCQSLALPSSPEYWHIGEIMMRLGSVTGPTVRGVKSKGSFMLVVLPGKSCHCKREPAAVQGRKKNLSRKLTRLTGADQSTSETSLFPGSPDQKLHDCLESHRKARLSGPGRRSNELVLQLSTQ